MKCWLKVTEPGNGQAKKTSTQVLGYVAEQLFVFLRYLIGYLSQGCLHWKQNEKDRGMYGLNEWPGNSKMSSQKYVPRKEWRWGQRDEVVPEDYYHTDLHGQTDLGSYLFHPID